MKTRFFSILMVTILSCAAFAGQSVTSVFSPEGTTDMEENSIAEGTLVNSGAKVSFKNDTTYPWTFEDGVIQNGNYQTTPSASRVSATLTIDTASVLSFELQVSPSSWSYNTTWIGNYRKENHYHYAIAYVDGEEYLTETDEQEFKKVNIYLEPGTHTIEWLDSTSRSTSTEYFSRIRNVELHNNWVDIDLATPGTLGVEVLYKVNVLTDVELLRVKGTINNDDWTNIKQMSNLVGLDLSAAKFDAVPENVFDGHSRINDVKLPEGMTSIGAYAFRKSPIRTVNIPSTTQFIGEGAYYDCNSLVQMHLPEALTSLGGYAFYSCDRLSTLYFPANLTRIPSYCCYECYNLKDLRLPANLNTIGEYAFYLTDNLRKLSLPENVNKIERYAFQYSGVDTVCLPIKMEYLYNWAFANCSNLTYVELPAYLLTYDNGSYSSYGYYSNFNGCPSLKTIVCKSATPPAIISDPFSNAAAKSTITLKVPAFAVANYKLDTYWYQFGNIEEIDVELDYWKIAGDLSLTNNRRMGGKPDLDLYFGGKMTVGGNAPMETANFNWFVNESNPGCLLNHTADFTAETLSAQYQVDANKWYFLTPVFDVDLSKVSHSANASFIFRYYDAENRAQNGTGNSWKDVEGNVLKAGQGYIFQCNASGTITLPAEAPATAQMFATSDVTTPLATHDATASANKNWNYVGNPYPTYYDVYYMDFTAPITVWTGSTYKAYSIVDDEFVLSPMQAFFVQKPDAVDNIIFHKEGRQLNTAVNRASYAKAQMSDSMNERFFLDLMIANEEGITDETRIVINEEASLEYEIRTDASKFLSMNDNVPQIYSSDINGTGYAINERPLGNGLISLAYSAGKDGFYEIKASRADGEILLHDNLLKKTVDLSTQSYTFYSASTKGIDKTRFNIQMNVKRGETGIENASLMAGIVVESGKGAIEIKGSKDDVYEIYTLDAKVVKNGVTNSQKTTIKLPVGSYLVKVANSTYKAIVY